MLTYAGGAGAGAGGVPSAAAVPGVPAAVTGVTNGMLQITHTHTIVCAYAELRC
jgi:hypothetical protein